MRALIIKKGAKGISVFMLIFPACADRFFDKNINRRLTIVPIQNDNMTAKSPADKPSIHPIPSINLPSPRPINFPFEKNQRRTKGKASNGPDIRFTKVGVVKTGSYKNKLTNKEKNETIIKTKTSLSGIILCRKS